MKTNPAIAAVIAALMSGAMMSQSAAQTAITIDATAGAATVSTSYTLSGNTSFDLGFFADYLLVGGGGGGAGASWNENGVWGGGGGGGGGQVVSNVLNVSSDLTVTVGAGGAGGYQAKGGAGGTSSLAGTSITTIEALGGGGGQYWNSGPVSGGGGINNNGGAGGRGVNANSGRIAGAGISNSITGTAVAYAGGGAGGAFQISTGAVSGVDGGGSSTDFRGSSVNPRGDGGNGTVNTGGGGGGASATTSTYFSGGNGGSGIVLVRYAGDSTGVAGGTAVAGTGSAAGYTIQQFTSTGASTFRVDLANRLNATLTGTLSGGGDFSYTGPGTFTLTADNTYTGTTSITGGTLQVGNGGATGSLGSGNVTNNAALVFNRSDSHSVGSVISGNGSLTQRGVGTTILAANNTYTGTTSITGGTLQVGNGGATGSLGSAGVVNNGSLAFNRSDDTIVGNTVSGNGSVIQQGAGALTLTGTSTYSGDTVVNAGELKVNGSIASSEVTVNNGAILSGSGTVGGISGAGSINPGNSPGILTAPWIDPSDGMFLNFEITDIKPEYSQATNSANDVLRLTAANPFAAAMDAGNQINVYFNVADFDLDQAFLGGIYTDDQADFTNLVSNATFNYYVQDDEGSVSYNGILYSVLTGYEIELGTALDTANFADGTVNGRIMQFTVVPEPSSALLVLIAGGAALTRRRRQPTA